MKNYIYFSVIAAAILVILAMLSILSGTDSSAGVSIESHTLVNQHTREESLHDYEEND